MTGAIKLYFRKLPIPLVTFDAYSSIMKATAGIENPEDPDADWHSFSSALKLLPKAHYATLKHLAEHLYRYFDSRSSPQIYPEPNHITP